MKEKNIKSHKSLSVKEYAELIGKSDKTVYKMIQKGLLGAKKSSGGYEVQVDAYLLERYSDINKNLLDIKELMKDFQQRLQTLEKKTDKPVAKKKVLAKTPSAKTKSKAKPLKSSGKSGGKTVKKPLTKTGKKVLKKSSKVSKK